MNWALVSLKILVAMAAVWSTIMAQDNPFDAAVLSLVCVIAWKGLEDN